MQVSPPPPPRGNTKPFAVRSAPRLRLRVFTRLTVEVNKKLLSRLSPTSFPFPPLPRPSPPALPFLSPSHYACHRECRGKIDATWDFLLLFPASSSSPSSALVQFGRRRDRRLTAPPSCLRPFPPPPLAFSLHLILPPLPPSPCPEYGSATFGPKCCHSLFTHFATF